MDGEGIPPWSEMDKNSAVAQWYRDFQKNHLPRKPTAIVVISAHWEESTVHITAKPNPGLYFDYYGFPDHTYELEYPAPGDAKLAQQIHTLLSNAGISATLNNNRDWDHGVFVPFILLFPDADVPIVQISLLKSLNPQTHIKIGKVLSTLRKQDVLIVGSGFATHNLRALGGTRESIVPWITWLVDTLTNAQASNEEKEKSLINWKSAPGATFAHPREEHLIPLHVAFGAANGKVELIYNHMNVPHALSFASFKFT